MNKLKRILTNTLKQIERSGWIAWSSIAVMTVAFLVGTIFAGLAYLLQLAIQSIETRDNIIVLFEVGTDQSLITDLQNKWSDFPEVKEITYTSEEDAYILYSEDETDAAFINALEVQDEQKLDSSLDIKLNSLNDIDPAREKIMDDTDAILSNLEFDEAEPPIKVLVDDETIEKQKETFSITRALIIGLMSLLFVIIFFFILMTVEYRTYNRVEEIGVMQLVGGSLGYIRAPYILEGGFYGAIGAVVSTLVLGILWFFLLINDPSSPFAETVLNSTRGIEFPWWMTSYLEIYGFPFAVVSVAAVLAVVGFILGAAVSFLAIRRYIK